MDVKLRVMFILIFPYENISCRLPNYNPVWVVVNVITSWFTPISRPDIVPATCQHYIPHPFQQKTSVFTSVIVLLRTNVLFVIGYLRSLFLKGKVAQSSSYPMPPCPIRPELSIYATNSHAAVSSDTDPEWLLTGHVSNLMSSHHCVCCHVVSENPSKVLCSSSWRRILVRLIFLISSPDHQARRRTFVILPATTYQIYWQLPSISWAG